MFMEFFLRLLYLSIMQKKKKKLETLKIEYRVWEKFTPCVMVTRFSNIQLSTIQNYLDLFVMKCSLDNP